MKKGWVYKVLVVLTLIIILLSFSSAIKDIFIRYTGEKVKVMITEVPVECDKYNHIKVLLDEIESEVNISNTECKKAIYKVGQQIDLIKSKSFEKLVWPRSQPILSILIVIIILLYAIITSRNRYQKNR